MIQLHGGPADGVELLGQRAPLFLRIVYSNTSDAFDLLDQLSDTPEPDESIYVYERVSEPVRGSVCYRDRRGRRGASFVGAAYRFLEHQPGDAHTRSNDAWQAWCEGRARRPSAPAGEDRTV